jgi:hypothetical protein
VGRNFGLKVKSLILQRAAITILTFITVVWAVVSGLPEVNFDSCKWQHVVVKELPQSADLKKSLEARRLSDKITR